MKEDFKMIAGMLKCKLHKALMTREQLELYDTVGRTMTSDMRKKEVTLSIPANADAKDVKKVKRQFELEGGGENGWPITFVTTGGTGGSAPHAKKEPKP